MTAVLPELVCVACRSPLPAHLLNGPALEPCPACGKLLLTRLFPALQRPVGAIRFGEKLGAEGEAACFFHPQKRAAAPCDGCGRFLCALCDIELHGRHFCATCLEAGRDQVAVARFENRRFTFDTVALLLAVLPWLSLCFYFLSVITAPVAIFFGIWALRRPGSLVRRGYARSLVGIGVGVLTLAGWGFLLVRIISDQ